MSMPGITMESGITAGGGISFGDSGGSPPPGILTFTYSQIIGTQDSTPGAGGNGTGVVIINPTVGTSPSTGPGIALNPDSGQVFSILALTPVPAYPPYGGPAPYLYTASWSAGSTYSTTPVEVGFNGTSWILYVLNPGATAGQAGTFNFPVTFAASPNTPGGPI
jgi:hypothetical protein